MDDERQLANDFVATARQAALLGWRDMSVKARCRLIDSVRHHIAEMTDDLVQAVQSPQRVLATETLAAELVPLCDSLRYLGARGAKILRSKSVGLSGRPLWMWGVRSEIQRVPRGVVLVIATWNYPLLLAGVQVAQALAAGNAVLWKPAPGCEKSTELLAQAFWKAGVPESCLRVLSSQTSGAVEVMRQGVDLVVLTGAAETGKKVLKQAAETLTPVVLELSGSDACVVLQGADLDYALKAYQFGLTLNSGATCIAPRRLMIHRSQVDEFLAKLAGKLSAEKTFCVHPAARPGVIEALASAMAAGADSLLGQIDTDQFRESGVVSATVLKNADPSMSAMNADIFGPVSGVMVYDKLEQIVQWINECPYGLSASIFGPENQALLLANQLEVGSVVINDLIAPTADPRLPFGGRRKSGFGVTRGEEGLLEMTVPRVVIKRSRGPALHLRKPTDSDSTLLDGLIRWQHGSGLRTRISGLRKMVAGVKAGRRQQ